MSALGPELDGFLELLLRASDVLFNDGRRQEDADKQKRRALNKDVATDFGQYIETYLTPYGTSITEVRVPGYLLL